MIQTNKDIRYCIIGNKRDSDYLFSNPYQNVMSLTPGNKKIPRNRKVVKVNGTYRINVYSSYIPPRNTKIIEKSPMKLYNFNKDHKILYNFDAIPQKTQNYKFLPKIKTSHQSSSVEPPRRSRNKNFTNKITDKKFQDISLGTDD